MFCWPLVARFKTLWGWDVKKKGGRKERYLFFTFGGDDCRTFQTVSDGITEGGTRGVQGREGPLGKRKTRV